MAQQTFNPIDYGFKWQGDWYTFDARAAEKEALAARNAEVKRLRAEFKRLRMTTERPVKPFTLRQQQITKGGIGSGHPEITVIVSVYGINY